MNLLIGLTGPPGAGKGTLADILLSLAGQLGITAKYMSLSDSIRKEVSRQGLQFERDVLKKTADLFRERLGNGVWALLLASEIEEFLATSDGTNALIVIDGIRNPREVQVFRSQFGDQFKLLSVTAPPKVLQVNLQNRKRQDESKKVLEDSKALENLVAAEMGLGEPDFGHNIEACIEMADWPPISNTALLSEFEQKVKTFAKQQLLPILISARADLVTTNQ